MACVFVEGIKGIQYDRFSMSQAILEAIEEGIRAVSQLKEAKNVAFIEGAAQMLAACFREGGKLLVCGNGGSLCDAMHFAEELTGLFRAKRAALPAIALSDPGHMSCVSNDMGFEEVFARAVEAYGKEGDVLAVLSTSGNSPNILRAVLTAKAFRIKTIAFLGKGGGKVAGLADLELQINGPSTSDRIQEAHMAAIHILIQRVEEELFTGPMQALARGALSRKVGSLK